MPVAKEDIDKILGIGTTEEDRKELERNEIIIIREGVTSGIISGILSSCYENCFPSIFLFTPSRNMVVDFLSAAAILKAFSKIEKIEINVNLLIEEGKTYEEKMHKILDTLKKDKEEYRRFEETIYR
jgi:predicted ATP-grasp superfamily ATP-dependent carboligase